jgi:hypothetical protein
MNCYNKWKSKRNVKWKKQGVRNKKRRRRSEEFKKSERNLKSNLNSQ